MPSGEGILCARCFSVGGINTEAAQSRLLQSWLVRKGYEETHCPCRRQARQQEVNPQCGPAVQTHLTRGGGVCRAGGGLCDQRLQQLGRGFELENRRQQGTSLGSQARGGPDEYKTPHFIMAHVTNYCILSETHMQNILFAEHSGSTAWHTRGSRCTLLKH